MGIVDIQQSPRHHGAGAAVAILPRGNQLAVFEPPCCGAVSIRSKHPRFPAVVPHCRGGKQHVARRRGYLLQLMVLMRLGAGDGLNAEQPDQVVLAPLRN